MKTLSDDHKGNKHLVNNVKYEGSGYFRNEKGEYLKPIFNELETNNKNRYVRDANRHE
jgi:hypothetical protein